MDLKPAMREKLEKMPVEQKKLMIAQYRVKNQTQAQRVDDTPEYFVSRLKAEPTFVNVQALGVSIRSKPKSWVQAFVRVDGLSALFELLAAIERKPK